jgi:hypothetical protein
MRSTPGPYAQYDGKVDVNADDDDAAIEAAFRRLKATSFRDRSRDCWRVERVERLL